MSDFITKLAAQRQKYLDGLDANEGDINLDIFEDFYPDNAHFVYEILQNAEDTKASKVNFRLFQGGCLIEHDGKRLFDEDDVRSITGIHNSTKKDRPDTIGRWGIGFKSVFVYTITPEVHSGPFAFKIVRLVKPEPIPGQQSAASITRFWLPFNHPEKSAKNAFKEVASGLRDLSATTLLFLEHIRSVSWQIGTKDKAELKCNVYKNSLVEIEKHENGEISSRSYHLRFTRPASEIETQNIAIAFNLEPLSNFATFDEKKPWNKQVKVVPAVGEVAVFFPTTRETSGLKINIHAPFIPTPDRASLKNIPENEAFFQQLASLAVDAMYELKEMGFLTREFLAVLPNPQDELGNSRLDRRFDSFRTAIIEAFNEQPLMPTNAKGHASAKSLIQAKSALKDVLSDDDLEFLLGSSSFSPRWAANRDLEGTRIQRFMSSLALRDWDVEDFLQEISDRSNEDYGEPDDDFMEWISQKKVEWLQRTYALLGRELDFDNEYYPLETLRIIRLSDGTFASAENCYFPDQEKRYIDTVPCIDTEILEIGTNKNRKKFARKFLEEIGVKEIGEAQLIEATLERNYSGREVKISEKRYKKDIDRILDFASGHNYHALSILQNYNFFIGDDKKFYPARKIYLDDPHIKTGLSCFIDAAGNPSGKKRLHSLYKNGFPIEFIRLAEKLGAQKFLEPEEVGVHGHPNRRELMEAWHRNGVRRTSTEINKDWIIPGLKEALEEPNENISLLIWNSMAQISDECLNAYYRPNRQYYLRTQPSSLVLLLRQAEWVPQEEKFVQPSVAKAELLPSGYIFEAGSKWLNAIEFGKDIEREIERVKAAEVEAAEHRKRKSEAAAELGLQDDDLSWVSEFKDIPDEERKQILEDWKRSQQTAQLPEREPSNAQVRAERVADRAALANERTAEIRSRRISIGRDEVKEAARQYLQQQYTTEEDIICQICKERMPFKLDDGSAYFETVELFSELRKLHRENFIALCPNHSAMFRHANSTKNTMKNIFATMSGNELELVLAQRSATIYFTTTHIADLKVVIETAEETPAIEHSEDS